MLHRQFSRHQVYQGRARVCCPTFMSTLLCWSSTLSVVGVLGSYYPYKPIRGYENCQDPRQVGPSDPAHVLVCINGGRQEWRRLA